MKLNLQKSQNLAGTGGAKIENVILARPDQIKNPKIIKKTKQLQVYVTDSEYETFLSLIGREPVSHVVYRLVHEFIRKNKALK